MLRSRWILLMAATTAGGAALEAPPGLFRDLKNELVGGAIVIHGKQLFIDDSIVEALRGATRVLNQPEKYPANPLIVPDKPWEGNLGFSSVMYDREEGFYKMWYGAWSEDAKRQVICYATSPDGLAWRKPITTPWGAKEHTNIVFGGTPAFNCAGVFKDPAAKDPERRYKMLYSDYPDGTAKTASTSAAFSPDGIHWVPCPDNPLIPFSDSHCCPFWDPRRQRYAAYLRYGPPNTRALSLTESEDFVHWSPKITLMRQGEYNMDRPRNTKLYQMEAMPYAGVYLGFISTYHGETIQPIPKEKEAWADKVDVQLAFSRNGRTWLRVGGNGAMSPDEHKQDLDWKKVSEEATFIPWGRHGQDWDWGALYPLQAPVVLDDGIRIYYAGHTGRHWASYHGDTTKSGIGLATLRLDGFVSIDAEDEGAMTTRLLVFIGDTLEVNADAAGGEIRVAVLDEESKVIEGFSRQECTPLTTDSCRHLLQWQGQPNCRLIQARPIRLRFHLAKARLYSFTPRIRHKHYVQSYD